MLEFISRSQLCISANGARPSKARQKDFAVERFGALLSSVLHVRDLSLFDRFATRNTQHATREQ